MKFFFLVTLLSLNVWAEGGAVGNGGDTVLCLKSDISPYEGMYNLDYLSNVISETEYSSGFTKIISDTDTFDKQIRNVIKVTENTFPSFSKSLQVYLNLLFKSSVSSPYSWLKAPYGLLEIDDENIRLRLPENCVNNGHKNPFIQTVVRTQTPSQIEFTYYSKAFDVLSSLQKSFLLIHEWLWNFSQDAESVRRANAVLHSEWTEGNVEEKMGELALSGMNFRFSGKVKQDYSITIQEDRLIGDAYEQGKQDGVSRYYLPNFIRSWTTLALKNTSSKNLTLVRSQQGRALAKFVIEAESSKMLVAEISEEPRTRLRYCGYFAKTSIDTRTFDCDTKTPGNQPDFILSVNSVN